MTIVIMAPKFISASEFFKKVAKTAFLYKNIWKEKTTTLLHSPRETDKTALAIDIALDIAKARREVVYVACEQRIYDHAAKLVNAPEHLSFCMPTFESPDDKRDYADVVISTIEDIVETTTIRTFVIDSVTRIAALSFGRNASVAYVMKRLVALQVRCKLSLLVISHDSTKATDRALLNLSDSEITIEVEEEAADASKVKRLNHFKASARDEARSRHLEIMSADGACLADTGSAMGVRPQASR